MSKPIEYSSMTKDKLMTYTFGALLIITVITAVLWSAEKTPNGWNLGVTLALNAIIAVGIAVGLDALLHLVTADSPLNLMSAAVFGLIVTDIYVLGIPSMATVELFPLEAPQCFAFVALLSVIGLVVFKKIVGLSGRKYVNPAAAAKLVVMIPFINTLLLAIDHMKSSLLKVPSLAGPLGLKSVINGNGYSGAAGKSAGFGSYMISCFENANLKKPLTVNTNNLLSVMLLDKFHGWPGGASSIAVIIVGIAFFVIARKYIKWRITVSYFVAVAIMSLILSAGYHDQAYAGYLVRFLFLMFIGSSVFLAFFMVTDPATTPLTYMGQVIFGVGVAILTVLMITYMQFFGASFVALVIMNLTTPLLDKVGVLKPMASEKEPKLPKGKPFTKVKTTACIRCGACMRICCNRLSPILIKQAFDKQDAVELMKLDADYCAGCGSCNFICPARINLKGTMLTYPMGEEDGTAIEQNYLKGTKDENIGVYSDLFSAKSSIAGQDGGVVTALLISGMQKGLFDAALVCKRTDGYYSEAVIAENVDEVMAAKGTKYMRVHNMSKLAELVKKGKRKIAIVGTPCQMRSARRIQQSILTEYPDLELTLIGLFCFEEFNYYKLKEETKKLMNVDLDLAEKTQIKKGQFTVTIGGKESSIKVRDLNEAVEHLCTCCPDFTAMYSDISVGSVGSADGYSTVIVRSDIGEKLLENLDVTKAGVEKPEIDNLSLLKMKRANQHAGECPTK